jgi:N utilization substance protein A
MAWLNRLKSMFRTRQSASEAQIRCLFEQYVPEVAQGIITIRGIAQDGYWTKVAVDTVSLQVDPIQACIGDGGLDRIARIVDALGGPKVARVDLVRWSNEAQEMISKALAPAQITLVFLCPLLGRALAIVSDQELPKAIGDSEGRNVRLASQLVGWDIELLTPAELKRVREQAANWFR